MVPDIVKSGRLRQSGVMLMTITNNATEVIPAQDRRVALWLSSDPTNRYTISDSPGVTLGNGINININTVGLLMRVEDWGLLVTKQLYAVTSVASLVIAYVPILLDEI